MFYFEAYRLFWREQCKGTITASLTEYFHIRAQNLTGDLFNSLADTVKQTRLLCLFSFLCPPVTSLAPLLIVFVLLSV